MTIDAILKDMEKFLAKHRHELITKFKIFNQEFNNNRLEFANGELYVDYQALNDLNWLDDSEDKKLRQLQGDLRFEISYGDDNA